MTRGSWRYSPFQTIFQPTNTILGGPETLRWINPIPAPGIKRAFLMMYANHRAFTYTAQPMKHGFEGPFKKYFFQAWAQRREPLWTGFVTTKFKGQEAKIKRTMRSWVVRRLRIAFVESMKRHGFTKDGEPLEGNETITFISGTVQFMAEEPIVKMNNADLGNQMDFCVREMIDKQQPDQVVKPAKGPKAKKAFRQPSFLKNQSI